MPRLALTVIVTALMAVPAAAAAQAAPLVLVVDAGPVRVDADALRAQLGEATGRPVVALGDARAREADGTLTLARTARHTWVLRHQRGAAEAWATHAVQGPALRRQLVAASLALLAEELPVPAQGAPPAEPNARTEPIVTPEHTWVRAEPDLVDPFQETWSPLRVAIEGDLMRPFGDVATTWRHASWHDLADPFAEHHATGVYDPWNGR